MIIFIDLSVDTRPIRNNIFIDPSIETNRFEHYLIDPPSPKTNSLNCVIVFHESWIQYNRGNSRSSGVTQTIGNAETKPL